MFEQIKVINDKNNKHLIGVAQVVAKRYPLTVSEVVGISLEYLKGQRIGIMDLTVAIVSKEVERCLKNL